MKITNLIKDKDFIISGVIGTIAGLLAGMVTYSMWETSSTSVVVKGLARRCGSIQASTPELKAIKKDCLDKYYAEMNKIDPLALVPSLLFVFPITTSTVIWFNYFRRKQK